jgi:hypothetical protein
VVAGELLGPCCGSRGSSSIQVTFSRFEIIHLCDSPKIGVTFHVSTMAAEPKIEELGECVGSSVGRARVEDASVHSPSLLSS